MKWPVGLSSEMIDMGEKTHIKTGREEFDSFFPRVKSFLEQDSLDLIIDGQRIRGYRTPDTKSIWIRDYSDMLRGVKYIEEDLKSAVDHFAETQADNGRIFDYFTTFPEKIPCEKENWVKYVRVPVEADVEFRFVKAAFLAWQATGDDQWIQKLLPKMDRALRFVLTNPWYWDYENELVKRAWLQFQITDDTFWGIIHGENSGYYEAFRIMALLHDYFQNEKLSKSWLDRADALKARMNHVCWNGRFYTHFVKLTPVTIPGVDESAQLSLSNPADINRGAATHEMAVSIIQEYMERREKTDAFAEWFSIDPPFPDGIFGDQKLRKGAYVNGGIMPLVGGELAKAAFDHGFEAYGVDILKRYSRMISKTGETYLWYFPDGTPSTAETSTSPEATPTDGWGSSAMLYGFLEGLAGVEDRLKLFQRVRVSPRWLAAEVDQADVRVSYRASDAVFGYAFQQKGGHVLLDIQSPASKVAFHVLLPEDSAADSVSIGRKDVEFINLRRGDSSYVDFTADIGKDAAVKIRLTQRD